MANTLWPTTALLAAKADEFKRESQRQIDEFKEQWTASQPAPEPPKPAPFKLPDLSSLTPWAQQSPETAPAVAQGQPAASSGFRLPDLSSLTPWAAPKPAEPAVVQHTAATPVAESVAPARPVAPSGTPQAMPTGQATSTPPPTSATSYAPSTSRGAEGVEQWSDLVAEAARAYNLPEATIKGLMEIESGGRADAVSSAGAQGLMQVMPFHFKPGENPQDPRTNIFRGAKVYADALARWGDPDKAAAAYFGAIDGNGNITTDTDGSAVDGHKYVALWRQAAAKYGGATPNAGATGAPPPAALAVPSSPPATGSSVPTAAATGSGADQITVRDQWGNTFTTTMDALRKRPGGYADLTIVAGPEQDMQRVALGNPEPMPEDASLEHEMIQQTGRVMDRKPPPLRSIIPWPDTTSPLQGDTPGADGLAYRAPMLPTDPEASTGAEYDPRIYDEGAREWQPTGAPLEVTTAPPSMADVPSAGPEPSGQSDPDQGPRELGYVMPATSYGQGGDDPGTQPVNPVYGPEPMPGTDLPPTSEPAQPSMLPVWNASGQVVGYRQNEPAPSTGRITWPNERQLAPAVGRDTGEVYGPAPVPEPPARFSPQVQAQLAPVAENPDIAPPPSAPLPGTPTLPGVSGSTLTEAVNQAGASQNQAINPLAVYQALQEVPFDVYSRVRSELISDAEQGRLTGTDPLAPFRAMGVQFPDYLSPEAINPEGRPAGDVVPALLMSGVLPDPADPLVAQGFRLAGRGIGAVGRRVGQEVASLPQIGTRVTGAIADNAERVAAADARMAAEGSTALPASLGPVPDPEVRIPRAGYATDISPGAEQMVRDASEANAPQEVVRRAEVARKAEEILGADPDAVQRWQAEALAEAPDSRAVRGEALRQAEYIDAENANRAIERLRAAQQRAKEAGTPENLSADDRFDVADALLEAAETARAFGISARASTAEGRAAARALSQRRNAITARQAFTTAERARQVGQDAAFAARDVIQASRRGQVTPDGVQRLRTLRDKLLEAERHGLAGDGAGGRLEALEARRAAPETAAVSVGPTRAARPGVGLGTRVATDVGNAALGSVVGATAGYAAPAGSEEERRRNAQIGATAGAVGFPIGGRLLRGRGRGVMAAFGPAPTPESPARAVAVGADPSRRYEFRYRVADLRELIPSNLPSGAPNPAFPRELQPRSRERVASQLQIDQIARGLQPDALLTDVGRLDAGPMIVGADNIVESGNGRTLALQRAAQEYPEQYAAYVDALRRDLGQYGLSDADLAGKDLPVLVRERVSDVDRAAFAQEANNAGLLRMSSVEQAAQDAGNLSDDVVTALQVGENDTIASALRKTENRDLVRRWVGTLAENERAGVLDASGQLSAQGYERLTNALLMRTYGAGAGERLARAFIESADPTVRNVQTALMQSLPDVARAEALIRSGQREAGLSIAEDVAAATEMLARLRRDGVPVREYLGQAAMFERELTPLQEDVLRFLEDNQRRPNTIREALRDYASRVENSADPNQVDMFGGEVAAITREDAWRGATATARQEAEARAAARRARRPDGAGLASANLEPVPEGFFPTGGPEGRLAVAGAPEGPVARSRPGPIPENVAPRGGPEGTLAQEGAPTPLARPTQAERGTLPSGGPEGRLMREGAPPEPANLPPVGDMSTGGPEGALTLSSGRSVKDVAAQIDEVLANPNAPGAAERLRGLHQDLQEISTQGFKRSAEIRARLQRNGLLRAGLASKDQNVDALVTALARVDPDRPEEMRAVLQVLSKPRLINRILEYQYLNMLSSPVTHGVNTLSNAAQIAGRLLLQNPLEFAYSGGRSTGVGAAFAGAGRGLREGLGEAVQIMRTGTSTEQINRATEIGDYSHVNRELLTEKFGVAGAVMHALSTRPLAAMDAMLGNMAYASAAEQYAQRTADRLLKSGSASVKGMSRQQARQHVMANIWDYPDVVEQAGRIEDYTLLRGKGSSDFERNLRGLFSSRVPEDAGFARQAGAFLANQIMPFVGVPINSAKQGAERTVGVPVNIARAARAYARGDAERGAELAAKATIGAAALTTATVLAMGDNITDDGPSDAGERAIWELTHRRNSFRVPGTDAWISWEGTPLAIPFGMVAGAKRGIEEANKRSEKKGRTDLVDTVGAAVLKGGQGAAEGFASQSFVRALGDHYQLLTGDQTGLGAVAASAAGTASRFVPASSMVNFLARVADTVERDAGKPQAASDIPENVGARIAARLPGIGIPRTDIGIPSPRQQLDPKLNAYGEPQKRIPPAPYYRGPGDMAGDPITRRLETAQVGAIAAPQSIPARGLPRGVTAEIPLSIPEQRIFQQASGQAFRRILTQAGAQDASRFPPDALEQMRADARKEGQAAVEREIGSAELARRVQAALSQKKAS